MGLAVFSSDALSSTAYATQEILIILAMAGTAALSFVLPISVAIVVLLAIVTFSYEQTIHAYPGGGGAYIVARDNLGELPAQVAGAALLMDYILTVAVSISSGVAQVASAFPAVHEHRVDARGRARRLRDVREPAGGEGVGLRLRGAHLLLRGHDDAHGGNGVRPAPRWAPSARCRTRRRSTSSRSGRSASS